MYVAVGQEGGVCRESIQRSLYFAGCRLQEGYFELKTQAITTFELQPTPGVQRGCRWQRRHGKEV